MLRPFICDIAESWKTVEISPREIDAKGLTDTGFRAITHLICTFKPDIVVVDAPTAWPGPYCRRLQNSIGSTHTRIVVAPKADVNHPVVAAASVLAKLARDERIHELSIEYGNIGSGYPSDQTTISFLRQYVETNHHLPAMVRKRWATVKRFTQIQGNLD
jgi:ribonuclease HII